MLAPGRSDVKLTRDLDEAVRQFHQARLDDGYAYLFLDRVSLRVRRPAGRASGCRCWWPTECAATAAATCWPFGAARAKVSRVGRFAPGSVPAWTGRQAPGLDRHRRLSRSGGGHA